jgi:hypothetical protein
MRKVERMAAILPTYKIKNSEIRRDEQQMIIRAY